MSLIFNIASTLFCSAISNGISDDLFHKTIFVDRIQIQSGILTVDARTPIGEVRHHEYQIYKANYYDCPGSIEAISQNKQFAEMTQLHTRADGIYHGFLFFESKDGETYRVWIDCLTNPNPNCNDSREPIPREK
jgi:hypothetical protein